MNRRKFLTGLFAILPAATCYQRIWKQLANTELDPAAMIGNAMTGKAAYQEFSIIFEMKDALTGVVTHTNTWTLPRDLEGRIYCGRQYKQCIDGRFILNL